MDAAWAVDLDAAPEPEQPVSSPSLSPSQRSLPLERELEPVDALAVVEAGAPWGGIARVEPATNRVNGEMPFAAASWPIVNPSVAAIEVKDSPGITVCMKSA